MCISEVMTIVIAFHGSGYRTFKEFYTLHVLPSWREAFPNLVSYTRFVELMPWSLMLLCCFLHTRTGEILAAIGTPAQPAKTRGKSPGCAQGHQPSPRPPLSHCQKTPI